MPSSFGLPRFIVKDVLIKLRAHQPPTIKQCPYIRQAVYVIEKGEHDDWSPSQSTIKKRIVLEWVETDLWHVRPFGKPFANPRLPQIVTRSILEALLVFQQMKGVHTDVNPNNVLLVLPRTTLVLRPTKLELPRGLAFIRSVVFRGKRSWNNYLTVTQITHWLMSDALFGAWDKITQDNHTPWCLAKISRLVGPIDRPEDPDYKDDFEMAAALEDSGYMPPKTGESTPCITVGSVWEELQRLPREIYSEACIDFIGYLLIIDPAKHPTAEEALRHPFISSINLGGVDPYTS